MWCGSPSCGLWAVDCYPLCWCACPNRSLYELLFSCSAPLFFMKKHNFCCSRCWYFVRCTGTYEYIISRRNIVYGSSLVYMPNIRTAYGGSAKAAIQYIWYILQQLVTRCTESTLRRGSAIIACDDLWPRLRVVDYTTEEKYDETAIDDTTIRRQRFSLFRQAFHRETQQHTSLLK